MKNKLILFYIFLALIFTRFSFAEVSFIYQDPKESAFVISIPKEFNVKGETARPYKEPVIWLEVENKKDSNTIFYISDPSVPLFVETSDALIKKGILEGSKYKISNDQENFFVVKYLKATDYIKDLFLPQLKIIYKDLELYELEDMTNFVKNNINPDLLMILPEFTAAQGVFKFSSKKKKLISKIFVITQKSLSSEDKFSIWSAKVITFHCPIADFEKSNLIFNKILETFCLTPEWLKNQAQNSYQEITDIKFRQEYLKNKYRIFFTL